MSVRTGKKGIYQTTTHLAVVLLLLIMFVSAAYFFYIPSPQAPASRQGLLAESARQREHWESRRPQSYRYVIERSCDCGVCATEPYIATEKQGRRTAVFQLAMESESGEVMTSPRDPLWVDDLFALLDSSLRDDISVRVEYDASYGFPSHIEFACADESADTYNRYQIRDFLVLAYR